MGKGYIPPGVYPPWVSITALASLVRKDDPRGVKTPSETLLPEEKKKSSVVSFSHGGKRHSIIKDFLSLISCFNFFLISCSDFIAKSGGIDDDFSGFVFFFFNWIFSPLILGKPNWLFYQHFSLGTLSRR